MKIEKRLFGTLADGRPVTCWTLTSSQGMEAEVLDYGATLRAVRVPDREGHMVDVVLGYDTLEEYVKNDGYLGATVGRFANRIGGGTFQLQGKTYTLAANNGANHIHGGLVGFDKKIWAAEEGPEGLRLSLTSPDGEEGYPGTLQVQVLYGWTDRGLTIRYRAETDQDTILNLTNHSYFNLDGQGTVQEQLLTIAAESFTENDATCLPTGRILPVAGTAMDFRQEKAIGRDADRDEPCVALSGGYDGNFILTGAAPAAVARSAKTGIVMTMTTDQPGVQLYTANQMAERAGKGGQVYGHRSAFCLETQHYPDAIHHPEWPTCVLRAGETFESYTAYAFSQG